MLFFLVRETPADRTSDEAKVSWPLLQAKPNTDKKGQTHSHWKQLPHILLLLSRMNKIIKRYKAVVTARLFQSIDTASSLILASTGFMSKCFRSAGSGCDSIWWNIAWFPLKGCIPLPTLLKLEPKTKSLCFCQKALTDFSCSPQLFCLRPFYDVAILVLLMAVTF